MHATPLVFRPLRAAFTLIEMIGVLTIIGVLAAMIVPVVIESIRDSKVSSAVASVLAARTAATNFYERYDYLPEDAMLTLVYNYKSDPTGTPPVAYTPANGRLDFGDLLVYQTQLLEQEQTPIGRSTAQLSHAVGSSLVDEPLIANISYSGTLDGMLFKSAGAASKIVYYFMPNLTTEEAAALAVQFNGPFGRDALSIQDFIDASIAGQGLGSVGGLDGANAWFSPGDELGEYHAYVYVFHR